MRAAAPGKLVLSGAYAVLFGAPALVTAVDRYALADTGRAPDFVPDEVRVALDGRPAPHLDTSALRANGEKLGLGSSAAALVAALAALELRDRGPLDDRELCEAVFGRALAAHARAQGGGSGIDVAASAHGGTLVAERHADDLRIERVPPAALSWAVWTSGRPASTRELIARVMTFSRREAARFGVMIEPLEAAARRGSAAYRTNATGELVSALNDQRRLLTELGTASGTDIVTREVAELATQAAREHAACLPSGAGGGDVVLFAGPEPPSRTLDARAKELGLRRLELSLGARGVHALGASSQER
jgi:phosphomevalonate kinase